MRLLLPLLLVGCARTGFDMGPDTGVPPEFVDESFCGVDAVDGEVLRLSDASPLATVVFRHDCPDPMPLATTIDDPAEAFVVVGLDGAFVEGDQDLEVEVELVATEPGVYEAQLTVAAREFGLSRTIELIGQVE